MIKREQQDEAETSQEDSSACIIIYKCEKERESAYDKHF